MTQYCRVCDKAITPFMSFGKMPIANAFLTKSEFANEYFFELQPSFCNNCHTMQILEQPDPNLMFHDNYAFFSQTSSGMIKHFKQFAQQVINEYNVNKNSFIIEIGCNDGILIKNFATQQIPHLGIEPSKNVADTAASQGINVKNSFFNLDTAQDIVSNDIAADVILAANVICHIPNIIEVFKAVEKILKPNGVFIFEEPYLGDVIKKNSYDQIYDEHVFLFSAESIKNIALAANLQLFKVEPQITHGGSMRYHICKNNTRKIDASVTKQLAIEHELKLQDPATYVQFKKNCENSKNNLLNLLTKLNNNATTIAGYAATSKSTTILNYCQIGPELIHYISDTTPIKQGKFSPGMHIPIKPYEDFKKQYPQYAVLFAWNHQQEIIAKESNFKSNGGKWVQLFPNIKLMEMDKIA